jgi:hypothetical protein
MRITEPNYYRYYKRLGLFTKLATSYYSKNTPSGPLPRQNGNAAILFAVLLAIA